MSYSARKWEDKTGRVRWQPVRKDGAVAGGMVGQDILETYWLPLHLSQIPDLYETAQEAAIVAHRADEDLDKRFHPVDSAEHPVPGETP